jgi:hypothetical protein
MGYLVKEIPISWINRSPDMGMSSFKLARVGWGYWRVLGRLWLRSVLGKGVYRNVPIRKSTRQTWRATDADQIRSLSEAGKK